MMKQWLLFFILLLGLSLTTNACSPSDNPANTESPMPDPNPNQNDVSTFDLSKGENGKAPTVKLSSGYEMPIIGLGTYTLLNDVCVKSVISAIKLGFRKFDSASYYGNEESIGEGIRQSGIAREEIFVTTKLYPNQFADAENAIDLSLKKLSLDYIDLMLLHHPGANDLALIKQWREPLYKVKFVLSECLTII